MERADGADHGPVRAGDGVAHRGPLGGLEGYGSAQQFIDEVLTPFGAYFAASSDPFRPVTVRSLHADGDAVIVLWDGLGTANDGQPYVRVVHADAGGEGGGRDGALRQHLVQ